MMRSDFPIAVLEQSADPPRARAALEQLRASDAAAAVRRLSTEQARILAALVSGSQSALELLAAHPDWLGPLLAPGFLTHPRREEGLRHELESNLKQEDCEGAFRRLRLHGLGGLAGQFCFGFHEFSHNRKLEQDGGASFTFIGKP